MASLTLCGGFFSAFISHIDYLFASSRSAGEGSGVAEGLFTPSPPWGTVPKKEDPHLLVFAPLMD
jgi:hypothetical protein